MTYMLIVGLALILIQISVTQVIKDYLITQRVNESLRSINMLSIQLAPDLEDYNAEQLYHTALQYGMGTGSRVIIMDKSGVVQVDSFSELNGVRLDHQEIIDVRSGLKDSSYGLHKLLIPEGDKQKPLWCAYYACAVVSSAQVQGNLGIVFVSSPIEDVMSTVSRINMQFAGYSAIVLAIVTVASFLSSTVMSKPVQELTKAIRRVGHGDFSSRVAMPGNDEFSQLARTFNLMSEWLENLDKSRNEFVANASHELKTPLASIKILTESLISNNPADSPELYKEFLSDINSEIDRLNAIINDLLTLVRMDREEVKLERMDVDLRRLVEINYRLIMPIAEKKGISVNVEMTEDITLKADQIKLGQVIFNLMDNAVKYSNSGASVSVRAHRRGKEAIIEVMDTGVGIPKEALPRIFERFFRVDKARSRATGGTGLGLSIVKTIVTMHGGTIHVESTEGVGSVFTIELPIS